MLQLYDKNKLKIKGLKAYKDYKVESILSSSDKTLSFLYPFKLGKEIEEEGYIQTKTDEFIIKEIKDSGDWKAIVATMNVEDLEGQPFTHFDTAILQETGEFGVTIEDCLNLALTGTGWTVSIVGSITKKRTVRMTNSSSWQIIQQAQKTYKVELEFDTLNKIIKVYQVRGSYKGAYFIDSLNLRALDIQGNSYDFYTRIMAIGKDDLTVTVSNDQYDTGKIKTLIWKDERYTDIDSLTEDATLKLAEISKPYRAYGADVIDLANMNEVYKDILAYCLGDTITLIDKDKGIKDKQRIVKIVQYPEEPERNSCEISNTKLNFEDVQKEDKDNLATVNNITSDNGTIAEGAIKVAVQNLTVNKLDVNDLNVVTGRIGTLLVTKLSVTDANIKFLEFENAIGAKLEVDDLIAGNITVNVLEGVTANLQTILTSFISGTAGQYLKLTSQNVTFEQAIIKDAMIDELSVSKLKAGTINTTNIGLASESGNMLISDNTIQISDTTRARVQIGKDASDDYNMYVWDASGNLMFDAMGLKADGIKSKIIRDDMISDTANIDGKKINIASLITSINNDGTSTIKGSKILLDDEEQTLAVAFSSLKTNVDSIQIGGRNLLSDSDFEKGTLTPITINLGVNTIVSEAKYSGTLGWKCVTSALNTASGGNIVCNNLVVGTQYIASIKIKCTTSDSVSFRVWNTSDWMLRASTTANLISDTWTTLSVIFTATQPSHRIGLNNGVLKTVTYYVDNIKVELGNKVTDWTPSPEDIDTKIAAATTAIGVEQGRINTLISNTTILDNGVTIQLKDAYSALEQTVDGINTKVANIQTDVIKITNKPIVFNNIVGGTLSVNTFTKNTGTNIWGDSGFGSSTTFINSESVSFTVVSLSNVVMFGLSITNPDTAYGTIKYAWYQEGANVRIYEFGAPRNSYIATAVGDVLKISIANNLVYYYRNDILIYTSLNAYTTPLILDVAVHTGWVTATGSISVTGMASRITSAESAIIQHTTDITNRVTSTEFTNVMSNFNLVCNFNNIVNGTFAGNTFTKDAGVTNVWDAGFSATNPLYNGDYVEFTVTNLSTNIMLGLANSTTGNGFSNINFAIYQALSGIQVYESNVPKGTKGGTLAVGHKLRVAIEDNKVNYYQNGTLIYTSLTVPVFPLYLDCSVYQLNAVVSNVTRGTLYDGLVTRMLSAETSLTDSAFTIQISKNRNKIYKVRYIRDWIGGNDGTGSPYSPRWQEIEAINNHGVNVALGKPCTAQPGYTFFNGSTQVTNGNPFDNEGCSYNQTMTNCYIILDLGSPISNIDLLRIFHAPYNDSTPATFNNTKTEVSEDGINWLTVFDSAISGKYKEITSGHVIALNNHFAHTMKGSFTDEGLTVDAGAMKIVDGTDEVILMSKDVLGNCGIEIGSRTHANSPYLDFHSSGFANDNDARIIAYYGSNLAGGGTGFNGTAQLNFHAGSFNFNNIVNCSNIVTSVSGQLVASSAGSVYQINHVGAENYMQVGVAGGYKGIYYSVCDAKLKCNITDNTEDSLSKILQFKHHSFDWKDGHGHVNMGWMANELQGIDREFVFGVEQEDNTEILQPIHNTILPHITRSIQQLHGENLLLKERLAKLELAGGV